MPWCEECAKYYAPTALNQDGTCPVCGRDVGAEVARGDAAVAEDKAPWHFKLLVVAVVVYLGWRFADIFL